MPPTKRRHPAEARSAVSKDTPKPIRQPYVLADLLEDITPEAMRQAYDWGPDFGREVIDD